MRVSLNQPYIRVADNNGYGYAAKMCREALRALGHTVKWRDKSADVEINFIQPEQWHWTGPYRIGYVPWESTKFRDGWVEAFNSVDEMWTPSPVIADYMVAAGVTVPVRVYEHGVESLWSPKQRTVDGQFNIFHHGAEALRKGGNETIRAFFEKFNAEEPVTLNMKMLLSDFILPPSQRIAVHTGKVPIADLVALYHKMHFMAYPSWGEGFGLTPIQAMATGMPVLITKGWAPYEGLLAEHNLIESTMVDSPWPRIHPGQVWKPNQDDFMDKMRWHYDNREIAAEEAQVLSKRVHKEYDWVDLTRNAFEHLK